jgi:hypothetical protein
MLFAYYVFIIINNKKLSVVSEIIVIYLLYEFRNILEQC